ELRQSWRVVALDDHRGHWLGVEGSRHRLQLRSGPVVSRLHGWPGRARGSREVPGWNRVLTGGSGWLWLLHRWLRPVDRCRDSEGKAAGGYEVAGLRNRYGNRLLVAEHGLHAGAPDRAAEP